MFKILNTTNTRGDKIVNLQRFKFINQDIYEGDPKIPRIVKKKYLKYLYKFETLVPFKVIPVTGSTKPSAATNHCWKYCPKSSTEMLLGAASISHQTSAIASGSPSHRHKIYSCSNGQCCTRQNTNLQM